MTNTIHHNLPAVQHILEKPGIRTFLTISSHTSRSIFEPEYETINGTRCRLIGSVPIKKYKINNNAFSLDRSMRMHHSVRAAIGILGAIFGGYAVFKIKEELLQITHADNELKKSSQFTRHIKHLKKQCSVHDTHQQKALEKLHTIADAHQDIFQKIRRKANITIALLVTMAASAVIGTFAAMFASWAVVTGAFCATLITGITLTAKWLFDSADKGHTESADAIRRGIEELNECTL